MTRRGTGKIGSQNDTDPSGKGRRGKSGGGGEPMERGAGRVLLNKKG